MALRFKRFGTSWARVGGTGSGLAGLGQGLLYRKNKLDGAAKATLENNKDFFRDPSIVSGALCSCLAHVTCRVMFMA